MLKKAKNSIAINSIFQEILGCAPKVETWIAFFILAMYRAEKEDFAVMYEHSKYRYSQNKAV